MAKDYRRTPTKPQKASFSRQLLLVLVSFLLGYLSALSFDFTNLKNWVNTQVLAQNPAPSTSKTISPQQAQLPKPKFEFYTLLTNEHNEVQETHAQSQPIQPQPTQPQSTQPQIKAQANPLSAPDVITAKPSIIVPPVSKEAYLVQVASFKSKVEAEKMKAALTLKGFMVNITPVTQQQINWYRVALGPFTTRAQAEKALLSIGKSEHIQGMIRKMDA